VYNQNQRQNYNFCCKKKSFFHFFSPTKINSRKDFCKRP